ncbi:MAG TPA: hypothetical protein VMS76_02470 [Planctomycetota bacterium]|nr:hypothetical protein [Planctomycetota bacterium]
MQAANPSDLELEREARVLGRYLSGAEPSAYVLAKYAEAHRLALPQLEPESRFDELLVAFARGGTFRAYMADAHARGFRPASLLRRKLVLLLAILECSPQGGDLDAPDPGSRAGFALRAAFDGARFTLAVAAGALLALPVHVLCALSRPRGAR